jgi:hypothetical protein
MGQPLPVRKKSSSIRTRDRPSTQIHGRSLSWAARTRSRTRFTTTTRTPTRFVRELFAAHGAGVDKLEVRRATLEGTYLAMVHAVESGRVGTTLPPLGTPRAAEERVAEVSS